LLLIKLRETTCAVKWICVEIRIVKMYQNQIDIHNCNSPPSSSSTTQPKYVQHKFINNIYADNSGRIREREAENSAYQLKFKFWI